MVDSEVCVHTLIGQHVVPLGPTTVPSSPAVQFRDHDVPVSSMRHKTLLTADGSTVKITSGLILRLIRGWILWYR